MNFHIPETSFSFLAGKVGLVTSIANDQSIAYGCARAFRDAGASLAVTYLNDKANPYVEPLARQLAAEVFLPLDVRDQAQLEAVFVAIRERWGRLDFPRACDRLRTQGRFARPAGRQLGGRIRRRDGHFLPLRRAHGRLGGGADERGRGADIEDVDQFVFRCAEFGFSQKIVELDKS